MTDVVVRLAGDALQVAHAGLVARALDLLDGVADATGEASWSTPA